MRRKINRHDGSYFFRRRDNSSLWHAGMSVANESRYGGLNGSARYAIFIGAQRANSHPPCGWCRRSVSAWCHTASGRGGTTYARDPDPSGSPGIGSRPWAPSPDTRLETRPATVAAWTRSGDRLSARWQVVNWWVDLVPEILGQYLNIVNYE